MTEPLDYMESLICEAPIVMRRRVQWSECDPAQVVYSGRFLDYSFAAYAWFQRRVLNHGESLASLGLGTPMKAVSLVFHKMLRPEDWFEVTLRLETIRTRSFDMRVEARMEGGDLSFEGKISPVFVDDKSKASQPIPPQFRAKLEAYQTGSAT